MDFRDQDNRTPEEKPAARPLPEQDAPVPPAGQDGNSVHSPEWPGSIAENPAAAPLSAPAAVSDYPNAAPQPSVVPPPPAAPQPPWLRTGTAPAAYTAPYRQPGYSSYTDPARSPGIPANAPDGAYRAKKKHTGRNVCLLILAFVFALALGGGMMFCAIYTGALADLEQLLRDPFAGPQDVPSEGSVPSGGDTLPPDDMPPVSPPDGEENQNSGSASGSSAQKPFVPVDGAPLLNIVTVEDEGENYREELDIPSIAELAQPSVVGVIKYVSENPQEGYTIGSGTIFTEDGFIITNEHVVSDPYSITVLLYDGTEYEAEVVASDDDADIAILKIDAHGLKPAEFGDSTQLRVGEISVAIGCPASVDLQGTTTAGIISALDRVITVDAAGRTMRLLQTDAAINPGNSGGPLLNKYGQVIGINTVKMSSTMYEGLCFAIPTSELETIVSDLFTYGYVRGYPAIGIMASSVMAAEDEYGGSPAGVLVASIDPLSGAYGLVEVGDIITHCNGTEVIAVAQINTIKNRLKVGDTITLTIYRKGETFDVEIVLVDQYDLSGD